MRSRGFLWRVSGSRLYSVRGVRAWPLALDLGVTGTPGSGIRSW